jgi:hypothetical protein
MRRCAVLLLAVSAATAAADPAPELTKEFQAGVDAFRLGHFDEARTHLEKARDLDPKLPGPHRFLAALAQAQGRWQDCLDEARVALSDNPHSSEAADTRKLHSDCRASAGRPPYHGADLVDSAAVSVTTNVPGATVKIGGLTYGGTPLEPRPITPGKLEVDIDKPGWKPTHVSIDAPAGIVTDIAVELEPDASQTSSEPSTKPAELPNIGILVMPAGIAYTVDGKPAANAKIELVPGTHEVEARLPEHDPWRRRVRISLGQRRELHPAFVATAAREHDAHIGLALLGGGAVFVAAGFATALVSEHASADAREIVRVETSRDPANPGYNIEPMRTRAQLDAARDRTQTYATVSDVAFGVGLVTAGIGAYFLYKGDRERADVPPPFAIAPIHGGAFVAKELRW